MLHKEYDCAIVGGGLAGLSLSVLLCRAGLKVILFEKENFPFHKVCGEYISNESVPFLRLVGVDLASQNLPQIRRLMLSSPSGVPVECPLAVGGTGLSRYRLDSQLFALATAAGVEVRPGTKVQQAGFADNRFRIFAGGESVYAKTAVGAFGKGSNIEVQLGRKYRAPHANQLFVAVKHHIYAGFFDRSCVEMHHFPGGYCGLSAIEEDRINLSYICTAANLKKAGGIASLEQNELSRNPFLKKYFQQATFIFEKPLTISHLSFEIKAPVADHLLLLGDAAGNIAPLSGNGMSMALRSAKLAYEAIGAFLNGGTTRAQMEAAYSQNYYRTFSKRIRVARWVNGLTRYPRFTDLSFRVLQHFPSIVAGVSKNLHGEVF